MPTEMKSDDATTSGKAARRLIRASRHAALATSMGGRPYASLVAVACDMAGAPLLLLSDLAQHTRNLAADPHVSLLFAEAEGCSDPLAAPRLTLLGHAERCSDPLAAARFAARHPASADYAGFADFRLYRIVCERAHLIGGFGRIAWIEADALSLSRDAAQLAAAEAEIVAHMNEHHADAVALYATRLLGRTGAGWRMTGIDPEGADLRCNAEVARIEFAEPVPTPQAARHALVDLAETARGVLPSG